VNGFIMAAGLGTRLDPFTRNLPKPLFPAGNRTFLDRGAALARNCGATRLAVNLHHLGHMIRGHVAERGGWGCDVLFSEEPEILGTGGGARRAAELLGRETLLIVAGDVAADLDAGALLSSHRLSGAAATVAVALEGDVERYGGITVADDGRIKDMAGIVGQRTGRTAEGRVIVNASAYILEADLLRLLPGPGKCLVRDFFIPLIEKGAHVNAHVHRGFWAEGGSPELLLDANAGLLDLESRRDGTHNDAVRIAGPAFVGEGVVIDSSVTAGPHAVIAAGCRLGEGCAVARSVLLPGAAVEPGERVEGAVRDAHHEWTAAAGLRPLAVRSDR
jgi:NDP-sugar pyrophosphorylase family protein